MGGEKMRGKEEDVRDPKGWFTPHIRNPEKYFDCRTDPIGGAAASTFAPGGKHPSAATVEKATFIIWNVMSNSRVI